jgi:hypothetical protein
MKNACRMQAFLFWAQQLNAFTHVLIKPAALGHRLEPSHLLNHDFTEA